jgi:solute carrier family 6 amino acid transporter-like protein 5/7/9/14
MCCSSGVYLFTVLDWNTASWAILIIGFAEVALVAWVYGMCEV